MTNGTCSTQTMEGRPESRINRAPWHFCGERDTRPWDSGKQYLIVKPEVLEPSGHPAAVPSLVQIRPRSFQSYAPFKPFKTPSHALATGPPQLCVLAIKATCHRLPAKSSSCTVIHVLGGLLNQATRRH